jgi:ABC-type phosphate transport system substrate-binding protein
MKTANANRRLVIASLAALVGLVLVGAAPALRAADPPLVVIVAATNPIQDISRANLRRAFLGEPTSGPGGKLIPLNQPPGSPARYQFDRILLGLDPEDVARFWIDQRIRGQGGAPRAIPAAMLVRVIPQLAGAIGYVRASELGPGVKIVTIDGKKPGDPDYLLP